MKIREQLFKAFKRVDIPLIILKTLAVVLTYTIGGVFSKIFHESSVFFGAMLACTSAIVVMDQDDIKSSIKNGWLRVLGTFIGALVATIFLNFFVFNMLGMAIILMLLLVLCMFLNIPDNGRMAAITLITVLVVSKTSPDLAPVVNGGLRFIESAVGVGIGILTAWIVEYWIKYKKYLFREK